MSTSTCNSPTYRYYAGPCFPKITLNSVIKDCPPGYKYIDITNDCTYKVLGSPIGGKRLKCRSNKNYCSQADSCCTMGRTPSGYVGCDKKFVPSNATNCQQVMQDYCQNDKLFSDDFPRCNDFCTTIGKTWCDQQKLAYCANQAKNGTFDTDLYCKDHCRKYQCTTAVDTYCQGENLESEFCKDMCFVPSGETESSYNCETHLQEYCAEVENQEKDICKCFLPTTVYTEYYDKFKEALPAASKALFNQMNQKPYCSYPDCATQSTYLPKQRETCPAQCFQTAFLDNSGKIVIGGDMIDQECTLPSPSACSDQTPCPTGYMCQSGLCAKTDTKDGTRDGTRDDTRDGTRDDTRDDTRDGVIPEEEETWFQKYRIPIYIGITILVLLMILIGVAILI